MPIERAVGEAGLLIADLQETGRTLGTGSYGEVVEVQVRGRRCAAKKLHGVFTMRDVPPKERSAMTERFETECRRVLYLSHPNIIEMIGIHFDQTSRLPTLVMELMDTSLCKYLENNSKSSVPLSTKYSILHDVASGLLYLHSLPPPLGPIVHRDLTAKNILLAVRRGVVAKIADLGQAKIVSKYATRQQQLSKVPGNDDHMPPEAWMDNPVYDSSLDVFSFGVVILHTLSHEWPEPLGRLKSAMEVCPEVERRKPYLDKITGSPLKLLVEQCLSQLTKDRPSTNDVFNTLKVCIAQMVCSNLLKATSLPCGGDIIELIHRLAGSTKGASNVAPQGHQTDYIIHSQPATPTVAAASAHQPQMSSAVSQVSGRGPPKPGAAGRPIPVPRKPRSNASKPADRGDKKKQNVHWLIMEGSQPSPGSQDSLIATLPPPITDFMTPLEDTQSYKSGIKMSGFPNPTGGGGYDSFSFPRDSGPQGLGDSQPPLLLEQTSASSSAMSQGTTASSSESLDLYGSGPHLQQRARQSSSHTKLDMVEGDRPHQERSQQPLRHIQSGSNLPAMEGRSFQRDPVKKLEKPQPAPRRSRSPSPTGSGEPSPSASPKLAPRHRATHEPWTQTGQNRPFPPPDASPKWQTLPRQAQSVEVEPQSNKVMPRFSSGSDLMRDKTSSKHLEFKPPVARFEPDTPVVGILPAHLKKLQSQSVASTQPVKPQTPPGGPEPPSHQSHTLPLNNCSEHIVKEKELQEQLQQEQQQRLKKEQELHLEQQERMKREQEQRKRERELQQEQQQRMELERRLKQLEQQQQQELQRQLQQQQEKEETQKRLRDLQLQLEQQQQQKKEICSKPPFLSQQQKSVAVSPTNAQATASLPKPDESQLEFGGEGAQALRAQKYSREAAGQQYPGEGKLRERANVDASRYRPKRTSTDKPTHKPPEQETSFTDPLTQDSGGVGTSKMLDIATHIYLEDTWVCKYCTNLNSDSLPNCEVCKRPDPRTWVCHRCQNHNPRSLSQCQGCKCPQEITV